MATLISLMGASVAHASEPSREFLDALQQRGYYDAAGWYLDEIATHEDLDREFQSSLPYLRATLLLKQSQNTLRMAERMELLARAEQLLAEFVRSHPSHPQVGDAESERARSQMERARLVMWELRSGTSTSPPDKLRAQARSAISSARSVFESAQQRHDAKLKSFPTFIDPEKKEERAARDNADRQFLQAQIDIAQSFYEEAQTYPTADQKLLRQALEAFEAIHQKYRAQLGGLHARLWQGKCYEELGEYTPALGIYGELLSHPSTTDSIQRLQHQTLHFRLICLNQPQQAEFATVVDEASTWLAQNTQLAHTSEGTGICWERSRAYQALAEKDESDEQQQTRFKKLALDDVVAVSRIPGRFQGQALAKLTELQSDLNQDGRPPTNFEDAFLAARNLVNEVEKLRKNVSAAANNQQRREAEETLRLHLDETSAALKSTLQMSTQLVVRENEDRWKQAVQAYYLLAYIHFLQERHYESAILAEHVGRRFQAVDPQLAIDGAYLAMAAYERATADKPNADVVAELDGLRRVCQLLVDTWPNDDKAVEARMMIGQIFDRQGQSLTSAEWYEQVPNKSVRYPESRLAAGQAYWNAYLDAVNLTEDNQPPADELQRWVQQAEALLREGINKTLDSSFNDETIIRGLIAAKVSLAQLLINNGQEQQAIETLIEKPHSVTQAIIPDQDKPRPETGINSTQFATIVYQMLLRAYVGTQQIDEAVQTMQSLEDLSTAGQTEDMWAIYVQLGKELNNELRRLSQFGNKQRLNEVRQSFDKFLAAMTSQQDQRSFSMLLWIAETYFGLGEGIEGDRNQSLAYFTNAAQSYQIILQRAEREPDFLDPSQRAGVLLRLANCMQQQERFDAALNNIRTILQSQPKALNAQIEAARVLQAWGRHDQPEKFLDAINGITKANQPAIWGWGQIALKLQRIVEQDPAAGDRLTQLYDARHNISTCRREYALAQTEPERKTAELERAMQDLEAFTTIAGEIEESWWNKFDGLYRLIQTDLGRTPIPLENYTPPAVAQQSPTADNEQILQVDAQQTKSVTPDTANTPSNGGSNMLWMAAAVILTIAAAVGLYFMLRSPPGRSRARTAGLPETISVDLPPRKRNKPGPTNRSRTKK